MAQAGHYDTQASFERKQVTQDSTYGTEVVAWVPLVAQAGSPTIAERFWVRALDVLQGRSESLKMDVALSSGRVTIRMRYRGDITSAMRVTLHRDTDQVYQIITDPAMIGRKEELEIQLEKFTS
jgi:head-tail adaptor